jgi:hypothetical protein
MIWTLAGRTKILFLCGERQRSYKAALKGIPIVAVDPRNTSRTGMCIDPQRRSENSTDVLRCRLRLIRLLLTLLVPGIWGRTGNQDKLSAWYQAREMPDICRRQSLVVGMVSKTRRKAPGFIRGDIRRGVA